MCLYGCKCLPIHPVCVCIPYIIWYGFYHSFGVLLQNYSFLKIAFFSLIDWICARCWAHINTIIYLYGVHAMNSYFVVRVITWECMFTKLHSILCLLMLGKQFNYVPTLKIIKSIKWKLNIANIEISSYPSN